MDELRQLPGLLDETAYMQGDADWEDIYLFLALADLCAERRLRPAVGLLLERASAGDPGETMRGLRHNLEAIADDDEEFLADACLAALASERVGARRWAVEELGRLQLKRTLDAVRRCLKDANAEVRQAAKISEGMIEAQG